MIVLGVAVIGCGYWGPNLARNFSSLPGVELRAVCDKDPARLEPLTRLYPAVRAETEPAAIFGASDIDAVAICTPVHTHAELARAALEHGLHVLVEKPLTNSVADAEALVKLADSKELTLQVDHTFVHSPAVQEMREMINRGDLGALLYIDSVRINLGLFQSDVSVVWDLAAHDVSIINYLVEASPLSITAIGSSHYGEVENLAYLSLVYPDSLIAHVHVNWLAPVKVRSTIVGGSKRMAIYDDLAPSEKLKVYDKGVSLNGDRPDRERAQVDYRLGGMSAPYLENVETLSVMCRDFIESIEQKREPLVSGADGLAVVRILAAAEESIRRGGQPVAMVTQ